MRKKSLLGLVAIPLIAIGSLTYATDNEFIVHDTASGTITVYSQDYSYGITIQDKNLGAENVEDYGYYFQWGNNHGNYAGTNTGLQNELLEVTVNDWVNKGYSGDNYNFIIFNNGNNNTYDYRSGVYYTSASDNSYTGTYAMGPYNNLRGGGNDNDDSNSKIVKGYDTENHTATNTGGRQGPCGEGYHVPSAGEWQELMMLWCNANSDICSGNVINTQDEEYARANYLSSNGIGTAFSNDLSLPLAGYRYYNDGAVYYQGNYASYWSSSPRGGSNPKRAWNLSFDSDNVDPSGYDHRANGQSLRCFKNSYVEPPKTLNLFFMSDDEEVGTGEVTENITGAVPEEAKNVTKTGYVLEYRFLSGADASTGFDFETTPILGAWADENDNVYFIAQWTPIIYTISFSGNAADATGTAPATINAEYDSGDIAPDNSFTLTGYTFTGWNTESDGSGTGYTTGAELKNLTTTSGANVELYAQWEVNVHKLNFVVDGTTIQSGEVAYAAAILAPAEPKKDCNSFAGWTSSVEGLTTTGTMPDSDVTFTANWNYTCSRSSGGGGGSSKTTTTKATTGGVATGTVATGIGETNVKSDDKTNLEGNDNQNDGNKGESQKYSDEFQQAYEFAYKHGITTMPTIEQANMEGPLTRIAMAKMLSYYAINVLGQKPDETRVNKFNDVSDKMNAEYNNAVILAYQLGIMGINMPKNRFRPNDLVTRGEFVTALSRMLYKIADGKDKYYSTHMAKLMEEKIITNDDPKMKELRGYVMIMLMRSAENKNTEN